MREFAVDAEDSARERPEETIAWRFEVRGNRVRNVRQQALKLNLPFTDEYDFRRDQRNADLELDLRKSTALGSYQQKAVSEMPGPGRAISGIIVLPCGAGKTLIGITATCTVRKSTIVFCNGAVQVRQ
jgi:DNA excision repair protein ERCC-3